MKMHNPELINALVDGELKGVRRLLVERHLRGCALCAAEYRHLHHVREMLAANPPNAEMSDSPEFFWSKVEREIQRLEDPVQKPARESYLAMVRRFLVPASAVAAVVIAGLMLNRSAGPSGLTVAAEIETALADAGAFTYRDYSAGTTLVWLSYPADKEAAEIDEMGTFE